MQAKVPVFLRADGPQSHRWNSDPLQNRQFSWHPSHTKNNLDCQNICQGLFAASIALRLHREAAKLRMFTWHTVTKPDQYLRRSLSLAIETMARFCRFFWLNVVGAPTTVDVATKKARRDPLRLGWNGNGRVTAPPALSSCGTTGGL